MIEPESLKELISLSCSPLIQFFTFTYWQLLTMTLLFPVLHSMPYAVLESYWQLLEFFLCIPPPDLPEIEVVCKTEVDWRPGGPGFESRCGNFPSDLWQFRLPHFVSVFWGDTKSRRSLLSGVYARASKRSHQITLKTTLCVILTFECFSVSEGKEKNILLLN